MYSCFSAYDLPHKHFFCHITKKFGQITVFGRQN